MSAPTEAEIQAAVCEALLAAAPSADGGILEAIGQNIDDAAAILRAPGWDVTESPDSRRDPANMADGLWGDLRPSEARRLMTVYEQAAIRATHRCERVIVEELTLAGLAFAAEFPEAPRPAAVR